MVSYKTKTDEGNRFMGRVGKNNLLTEEVKDRTTSSKTRTARNRNKRGGEDY